MKSLRKWTGCMVAFFGVCLLTVIGLPAEDSGAEQMQLGREIYMNACANCHGADGRGVSAELLGFDQALPDFTDCQFARREPDADWVIVAHQGGPIRGFSRLMPAFGEILTHEQLLEAVRYIRVFCGDQRWPRGELNMPKALVTGKAMPEDELLVMTTMDGERSKISTKLVYENRIGARGQFEVAVPFGWARMSAAGGGENWSGGNLGDIALGYKQVLWHNHKKKGILSLMGEVILPTGNEDNGFGKGTVVLEPFLVYSQALPGDFFFHTQLALEYPLNREKAETEGLFRFALGKSFTSGPYGRTWSPMLGFLAARELEKGGGTLYDLVPQLQFSLNKRQHILFNVGVRIPINHADQRDVQIMAYILWDWFDGGFFEGW